MNAKGPSPGILTFLIADIRGYTAFTQQRGDEAAGRLAQKFAEVSREGTGTSRVVQRWGTRCLPKRRRLRA